MDYEKINTIKISFDQTDKEILNNAIDTTSKLLDILQTVDDDTKIEYEDNVGEILEELKENMRVIDYYL